jgi:flagellar assembly protein FliH
MSCEVRRLPEVVVEPFAWESIGARWTGAGMNAAASMPDPLEEQLTRTAIEREAFARGYAEGERAASEAARARTESVLRRLTEEVERLGSFRADVLRGAERQTVQLVLAIAERVVQREVALERHVLVHIARGALARLGERVPAAIRLHPDDYDLLNAEAIPGDDAHVRVVADPAVERGGCLVESDHGLIDASPDTQIRELTHALFEEAGASPASGSAGHAG